MTKFTEKNIYIYIYFLIFKIYTKKGGQELSYYSRNKVLTCRRTYDHIQIKIYYC